MLFGNDKIRRARVTLNAYRTAVPHIELTCPPDYLMSDMLCDLRHWCATQGYDFEQIVDWSQTVFATDLDDARRRRA